MATSTLLATLLVFCFPQTHSHAIIFLALLCDQLGCVRETEACEWQAHINRVEADGATPATRFWHQLHGTKD